jgi:hypothetical protein
MIDIQTRGSCVDPQGVYACKLLKLWGTGIITFLQNFLAPFGNAYNHMVRKTKTSARRMEQYLLSI